MAVCTDDVLIVGVERDYDCLCLGEDKALKQKRLQAKAQGKEKGPLERKSGKGLESREVEVTCTEDSATVATKPNSTQSSPKTHNQADKVQSTTMQQFPHQPLAGSVYPHPPQHGATPNNIAHAQPLVAPTTGQLAFNGAQGGTNSYGNQGLAPAQQAGAASSSQPQDGDLDWISTSEWDTILNGLPLIADTDQKVAPIPTNQHPNGNMISKGTSDSTSNALATPSALYGSSAGASGSSMNTSDAAPRPAVQSQSGAGFADFADTTEKDSATQSALLYTHSNSFNSTNYPASNATPNTANQNQNQNLTSFNAAPTTQSNSLTAPIIPSVDHSPPTSITHNCPPQVSQLQQPVNTFQAQHQQQQSYSNTSMATGLPNYQAPPTPAPIQYPVSNGSVRGKQQGYTPVNTTLPSSQSSMNSNNAAFFHPSPNSHALMPPQATQLQSGSAQQLPFNAGAGAGAISAPSNSQMMFAQQSLFNSSHPSSASGARTEHLQNDEVLARKLQEDEYIKGMRRSKHGDERLAMSLLANDLSIGQARNSIPNNTQYPQQQQQFPPPSAMQIAGPSNFSTNVNEQLNATVLSNADKVLGDEQQEQGPGGNVMKHPTCWTQCPNCPSEATRKYHLIDVERGSPEWNVVSQPLFNSGFSVKQVQRIQNETLWQRLFFEKQLMLRDRPSCNEKFLYHTSRAKVAVICEEGLDPRLSRNGLFGSGIYFSDNPIKCDKYWANRQDLERTMFCCRVLLGDTKVYPKGKSEQLKREPPKENPQPGEPKTYDSVKGNVSGQDEFVVYNAYRVMPEYVIKYNSLEAEASPSLAMRFCTRRRPFLARRISAQLPYPNPHSTVHSIAPPVSLPRTPPVPFIGGPSNYYNPMALPDSARFNAAPVMLCQPCFGVQSPMFQSPTPLPPYPTRSM